MVIAEGYDLHDDDSPEADVAALVATGTANMAVQLKQYRRDLKHGARKRRRLERHNEDLQRKVTVVALWP